MCNTKTAKDLSRVGTLFRRNWGKPDRRWQPYCDNILPVSTVEIMTVTTDGEFVHIKTYFVDEVRVFEMMRSYIRAWLLLWFLLYHLHSRWHITMRRKKSHHISLIAISLTYFQHSENRQLVMHSTWHLTSTIISINGIRPIFNFGRNSAILDLARYEFAGM